MTNLTTAERIHAPVGAGATNTPADVRVVQNLLNRATNSALAVDGDCGPRTREAITAFQAGFLRQPDGRIDPDGPTMRRLAAAAHERTGTPRSDPDPTNTPRLEALPHGSGFYRYSPADRQYGTDQLLRAILDTGATLHRQGLEYGVGDLSFTQGGHMPPHKTHQSGRHADLRPLRNDRAHGPTSIGDPTYSRDATRTLVETLLANSSVRRVLFNDTEIPGVRTFPGHHNHLHIEVG